MTEKEQKLIEKIARILEQAEGFRRHGEDGSADAALARVEDMLMKHSIDMATVDALRRRNDETAQESIVQATLLFKGIYRQVYMHLAHGVCTALETLSLVHNPVGNVDELWIIGHASDVEYASLLLASIQTQCLTAVERWWKTVDSGGMTPMEKYKERRQFIVSFRHGVTQRIQTARAALRRASESTEPGTAVAIRDRRTAVENWVDAHYNLTKGKSRALARGGSSASHAGLTAGRSATTGEARVGVTRRSIEA